MSVLVLFGSTGICSECNRLAPSFTSSGGNFPQIHLHARLAPSQVPKGVEVCTCSAGSFTGHLSSFHCSGLGRIRTWWHFAARRWGCIVDCDGPTGSRNVHAMPRPGVASRRHAPPCHGGAVQGRGSRRIAARCSRVLAVAAGRPSPRRSTGDRTKICCTLCRSYAGVALRLIFMVAAVVHEKPFHASLLLPRPADGLKVGQLSCN